MGIEPPRFAWFPQSGTAASALDFQEEIAASAVGVDPVGVASLAFNASGADPAVAQELRGFLHEQRVLASKQCNVADKQSALLVRRLERAGLEKEHIEAQNHHLHLQHIHDRLRLVLDVGLARGALNPTASTPIEDAWTREIRVEVPETGMSLGDIQKFLCAWLGHDLRISGDVVQSGDALVLTVRGNGVPGQRLTGKASELDLLIGSAAERTLGVARPLELLGYLESTSRHAEAAALAGPMLASATATEAPQILNMWGNALTGLDRWTEALDRYREANQLSPDHTRYALNETLALERLGREEEAYRTMIPDENSTHGTSSAAVMSRARFNTAMFELRREAPDLHESLQAYARMTGSTHLLFEMLIA